MTEQALPSVNDLDLPFFDYNEPGLVGELHPAAPAELGGVEGIYGIESLPLAWSQV